MLQDDVKTYTNLVHNGDVEGVLDLLTNKEVEKRVLQVGYMNVFSTLRDIVLPLSCHAVN